MLAVERMRKRELSTWKDFSRCLEQFLASVDKEYVNDFNRCKSKSFERSKWPHHGCWGKAPEVFFCSLLASMVKHRPLMVVEQTKDNNGLQEYCPLLGSLKVVSRNRSLGLDGAVSTTKNQHIASHWSWKRPAGSMRRVELPWSMKSNWDASLVSWRLGCSCRWHSPGATQISGRPLWNMITAEYTSIPCRGKWTRTQVWGGENGSVCRWSRRGKSLWWLRRSWHFVKTWVVDDENNLQSSFAQQTCSRSEETDLHNKSRRQHRQ